MLDAFQEIAQSLGLSFAYGTQSELNALADAHTSGLLLFHEGYFRADQSLTTAGHLVYTHNLSYLLLTPSALADAPGERAGYLGELLPVNERILAALARRGNPAAMRVTMNLVVNLTDRNLDALRQSMNLTTPARSLC